MSPGAGSGQESGGFPRLVPVENENRKQPRIETDEVKK